ncbi:major facilitator superfamily domain-containing protein [Radiomyces spectabilis]|uniref:major facilitator superfamily domain-containing protein n=1 Tax=Radiomyces spectabilis TaxID=64574 RepID=UPI00221EC1A6|nr:major facilitator superfamily domain-containing protein [Radiomyces spectabilis]KAI8377452.1 major facilitator superfamily domain-containing protein [Radiomyces spectabilis]
MSSKEYKQLSRTNIVPCIVGSFILWISFGIRQSFGLFLIPITQETGWDRATFSIAAAVLQLVWGFSQPFSVYLAEQRLGFGKIVFISCLIYGVGCFIMYAAHQISALFVFGMGIVVGVAAGGNSFPTILASIGRHFPPHSKQQSMAFGIVSSFGSFGQCTFLPITRAMLQYIGWRWSALIMGFIMIGISPCAYFIRSTAQVFAAASAHDIESTSTLGKDKAKTEESGNEKNVSCSNDVNLSGEPPANDEDDETITKVLKKLFTSPTFYFITLAFSACGFHITFLITHFPAYLQDQGYSPDIAAWAISIIGLCSMIGSVVMGYLCAYIKPKYLLFFVFFVRAIMFVVITWAPTSVAIVFTFSTIFGLLWLCTVPLTTRSLGTAFGYKYIGTLSSIIFVGHQIAAFLGAYIGGVVYDAVHTYTPMWYVSLALSFVGMAASLLAQE